MKNVRSVLKYTNPVKKYLNMYNIAFRFKYTSFNVKQFTDSVDNNSKNANLVINCK